MVISLEIQRYLTWTWPRYWQKGRVKRLQNSRQLQVFCFALCWLFSICYLAWFRQFVCFSGVGPGVLCTLASCLLAIVFFFILMFTVSLPLFFSLLHSFRHFSVYVLFFPSRHVFLFRLACSSSFMCHYTALFRLACSRRFICLFLSSFLFH